VHVHKNNKSLTRVKAFRIQRQQHAEREEAAAAGVRAAGSHESSIVTLCVPHTRTHAKERNPSCAQHPFVRHQARKFLPIYAWCVLQPNSTFLTLFYVCWKICLASVFLGTFLWSWPRIFHKVVNYSPVTLEKWARAQLSGIPERRLCRKFKESSLATLYLFSQ
jgi:hypothetical protein